MQTTIQSFIKELINAGIYVNDVSVVNDELAYTIQGFAKSGYGKLFVENGEIYLETRYQRVDKIESLEDIICVAYAWDKSYSNSEHNHLTDYNPWYKLYKKYNFIR